MALSNSNIKLHLPFIGANNATITKDYSNSNHALTFNGNAKISTAQSYYNGGSSLYLDGNGDYLQIADSSDFDFGTGDLTLKIKVYFTAFKTTYNMLFSQSDLISVYWQFWYRTDGFDGGNKAFYFQSSGTTGNKVIQYNLSLNTWYDIMLTRKGSLFTVYVNDLPIGSFTDGGTLPDVNGTLKIGWDGSEAAGTREFQGYMQDIMIVKGEAWNTHKFYDTTLDTKSSYLKAAWKFGDYGVNDAVGANTLTNNNTVTFADIGMQGYKTATFNGSNQSLNTAAATNDAFDLAANDFAISFWVNFDASLPAWQGIIGKTNNAAALDSWIIEYNHSGNQIVFLAKVPGDFTASWTWTATAGIWYHIVMTRNATNLYCYINGDQIGLNIGMSTYSISSVNKSTFIGKQGGATDYFKGNLQEILVYNGAYLSPTEVKLLYMSGKAKLLQLERREHKQYLLSDNDSTFKFHNATLDAKASYLKAAWKFGDYGVRDVIGTNNGTNTSVTFAGVGLQGYKNATFNGSAYIDVADNVDLNFGTGTFAISCKVNFTSISTFNIILAHGGRSSSAADTQGWMLYFHNSNILRFISIGSDGNYLKTNTFAWTPSTGVTYDLIITRDTSNDIKAYINGAQIGSTSNSPEDYSAGASRVFTIGSSFDHGDNLTGTLQDVLIYKGTYFNQTEIDLLYASGKARLLEFNPSDRLNSYSKYLVAGWKFDESGKTRYDSVNHYSLTDNDSPTYYDDPVHGRVLDLNGSSQYIQTTALTATDPLHLLACHTINMWIKPDTLGTQVIASFIYGGYEGWISTPNATTISYTHVSSNNTTRWASDQTHGMVVDTWYMCTFIADTADNKIKLYINGNPLPTANYDGTITSAVGNPDGGPSGGLVFGYMPWAGYYYNGKISDVKIWNGVALDVTAISQLYNAGVSRFTEYNYLRNRDYPQDNIIEVFPLTESNGTYVGKKNSYATVNTGNVSHDTGKQLYAASFNGSNYLEVLNATYDFSGLFATCNFSVGLWLKTSGTNYEFLQSVYWDGASTVAGLEMYLSTGKIAARTYSATGYDTCMSASAYNDNNWHRIFVARTNTVMNLYVDGILVHSLPTTYTVGDAGNIPLTIGSNDVHNLGLVGLMQELVILDRAVDIDFITADYNSGNGRFY